MSSPTENAAFRLPVIEYLRGFAALSVAWFHITNGAEENWLRLSGSYGWLGVEIFFVISGFVIPLSIANSFRQYSIRDFPRFMARRLLRLEPPYLVSIVLVIGLWELSALTPEFQGQLPSWSIGQCMAHLFYLVPLLDHQWLQPIYWSLAWEFAFYISMGLLYPALVVNGSNVRWYLLTGLAAGFVLLEIVPARILLFVMGIATFRMAAQRGSRSDKIANAAIVLMAGTIVGLTNPAIAIVGTATAALIHLGAPVFIRGALHARLMVLGGMSYSLYLIHVPVGGRAVNLARRFVESGLGEALASVVALAICVMFAYMFSKHIEKPSIALAKRMTHRKDERRP